MGKILSHSTNLAPWRWNSVCHDRDIHSPFLSSLSHSVFLCVSVLVVWLGFSFFSLFFTALRGRLPPAPPEERVGLQLRSPQPAGRSSLDPALVTANSAMSPDIRAHFFAMTSSARRNFEGKFDKRGKGYWLTSPSYPAEPRRPIKLPIRRKKGRNWTGYEFFNGDFYNQTFFYGFQHATRKP